jgi:hypothetical protein
MSSFFLKGNSRGDTKIVILVCGLQLRSCILLVNKIIKIKLTFVAIDFFKWKQLNLSSRRFYHSIMLNVIGLLL